MEIGAAIPQTANRPDTVRQVSTSAPVELEAPAAPPSPPPESQSPPVPREVLDALAAKAAANTRSASRVRLDDSTDRVVVQFLNAENEVIKQYPPEELLDVLRSIREVTGLLLDRQA